MELKTLATKAKLKLTKEISKDPTLEKIDHAESREALVSILRDRVFHDDKKVDAFLNSIEAEEPVLEKTKKTELSESEFTEFLQKVLEKGFKEKSSKFKFVSHYFSTEKDLVVKIADSNGFESVYRVMTVKTT